MNEKVFRTLEFDKIKELLSKNTVSSLGKEKALSLTPFTEKEDVLSALGETNEALSIMEKIGSSPINGFNDIRKINDRLKLNATLSMKELLYVAGFLSSVRNARRNITDTEEDGSVIALARLLTPAKDLEDEIFSDIVNEDEMADNASAKLASIRRQIKKLSDGIKERLTGIMHALDKDGVLQEAIVTMRNDRYVLPVIATHKGRVPGIVHDQSASGATLFIEPMAVVEINNNIRQLKLDERDEIVRILEDLSARLHGIYRILVSDTEIMTQLDFIFAKAKLSRDFDGVCPDINDKGFVKIVSGRHPLLDRKKVVPITLWLGKEFTELLITGPNTGGKTVTLKTVGLFALMTQSGLHIPALPGSKMPVFDNVFADIGDEQSIEQNLSTFSSHMKNIAEILKNITDKSLVLFDELGAGTDPTEGAALAMSILEEMRKRRIRTIVTSHYAELKAYSLSHGGCENASVEFDVVSLKPTYRLMVGVPGNSNAFLISSKLGLEQYLIDRARSYIDDDSRKLEKVLTNAEEYRASAQAQREEAQQVKNEVAMERRRFEKEKKELEKQKEKMIRDAEKQAEKIREKALNDANEIIEKMKNLSLNDPSSIFKAREERKKLTSKQKNEEVTVFEGGKPIDDFLLGMDVYVTTLDKEGVLESLPNAKGKALVRVGIVQMEIPKENLTYPKNSDKKQTASSVKIQRSHENVSASIDVRGQFADEAIANVDMYLDLAYGRNLGTVTIIHGKGTGALRNAINEYLRQNKRVKSFRMGAYGEGDAGVTVVEFK